MNEQTELSQNAKFAHYNPRTISRADFASLGESMKHFGDLSGVVKNIETGNLVCGHQRVRSLLEKGGGMVQVVERLAEPNEVGTVARGYIVSNQNGELFAYREVSWPEIKEKAANIAANRIQGQFESDPLSKLTAEIKSIDEDLLKLTGQGPQEIASLLQLSSEPERPASTNSTTIVLKLNESHYDLIVEAIGHVKSTVKLMPDEQSSYDGEAIAHICRLYLDAVHKSLEAGNETQTSE